MAAFVKIASRQKEEKNTFFLLPVVSFKRSSGTITWAKRNWTYKEKENTPSSVLKGICKPWAPFMGNLYAPMPHQGLRQGPRCYKVASTTQMQLCRIHICRKTQKDPQLSHSFWYDPEQRASVETNTYKMFESCCTSMVTKWDKQHFFRFPQVWCLFSQFTGKKRWWVSNAPPLYQRQSSTK